MYKRTSYEAEIKAERAQKRATMFRRADIIARTEKAYGSTDLADDGLFAAIYEALLKAGIEIAEVDCLQYRQILSKRKVLNQKQEEVS